MCAFEYVCPTGVEILYPIQGIKALRSMEFKPILSRTGLSELCNKYKL